MIIKDMVIMVNFTIINLINKKNKDRSFINKQSIIIISENKNKEIKKSQINKFLDLSNFREDKQQIKDKHKFKELDKNINKMLKHIFNQMIL